ncbi:hypothetical protein C0J52_25829 [Blattella germanica]|nr:hypothetical protein C0J52_25829 [Blattella germanica]
MILRDPIRLHQAPTKNNQPFVIISGRVDLKRLGVNFSLAKVLRRLWTVKRDGKFTPGNRISKRPHT